MNRTIRVPACIRQTGKQDLLALRPEYYTLVRTFRGAEGFASGAEPPKLYDTDYAQS